MIHSKKTVVFDLDGTLIDTASDIKAALDASTAPLGLKPLESSIVKLFVGKGSKFLIQKMFQMATRVPTEAELNDALQRFLRHYECNIAKSSQPFPGIIECLEWLLKNDFRIAVCTNKPEHLATKLLQDLNLLFYFHALTGGDTLGVQKPDPIHLEHTIQLAGGNQSHALMIGDSTTDVQVARNSRVPIIVVGWGYTQIPPAELGGDILVNTNSELIPAIKTVMEQK